MTFQDGADLEPSLEHAQATHEHTEEPKTQLGSVSFVDAIKLPAHFQPYISNVAISMAAEN